MIPDGPWLWADGAFEVLAGTTDDMYQRLWGECRLRFGLSADAFDLVDERSARLVCAALTHRKSVYIGLPDAYPHRAAVLFATALLRDWMNLRIVDGVRRQRPTVLYFGTTTGIRSQLEQVSVCGWNVSLASVFSQTDLARGGASELEANSVEPSRLHRTSLPHVLTVYAPVDPAIVFEQYHPRWIAVDCDDAPSVAWLSALLAEAQRRALPVVAWGNNPLSECVATFAQNLTPIFSWPHSIGRHAQGTRAPSALAEYLLSNAQTVIRPTVLMGKDVERLGPAWASAARLLARALHEAEGLHAQETVRVYWRYLRALEQLAVPVALHEAEAPRYWGLESLDDLRSSCEAFRASLGSAGRPLLASLVDVEQLLVETHRVLRDSEPPLWTALYGLSIDDPPPSEARLITFTSWARKQLFLFALLSKLGLSHDDLLTRRIGVACLDDLLQLSRARQTTGVAALNKSLQPLFALVDDPQCLVRPLLVGVPGVSATAKLMPLFRHQSVEVLLYGHQSAALAQRLRAVAAALDDLAATLASLADLAGQPAPDVLAPQARVALQPATGLETLRGRRVPDGPSEPPWAAEDAAVLVVRLLDTDPEDDSVLPVDRMGTTVESAQAGGAAAWCESAVEIRCEGGWQVRLAMDDAVNVVIYGKGVQVQERSVRSLRPGDHVLLIHGQRRQSLYDLIVTRVHNRPGMELHLGLIRQWYVEFGMAVERHRAAGKDIDDILVSMRAAGSRLTSPDTLRSWLRGERLCPSDAADLLRLADAVHIDFVRQHHKRIHGAATILRGLHRSLSSRLNRWLERQAAGVFYAGDDEPVDPHSGLGLTFGDFRTSM